MKHSHLTYYTFDDDSVFIVNSLVLSHKYFSDKIIQQEILKCILSKMIQTKFILFIVGTVISISVHAQQNLKLNYNKPAENWNEALPIGNGKLGAMIFGGATQEHLQLNEETIWAGEPGNNVPKNTFDSIQKTRKLLNESKLEEAQNVSNRAYPRQAPKALPF